MATSQVDTTLSKHDFHVLNVIFDPESALSSPDTPQIDHSNSAWPSEQDLADIAIQAEVDQIIRPLGDKEPDTTEVQEALEKLDNMIVRYPSFASAYTNRAQVRRLLFGDDLFTTQNATAMEVILKDLSKAISIITPSPPSSPITARQAKVISTAYTHRAYLLHTAGRLKALDCLPQPVRAQGADALQEMASADFAIAGRYGDKVAQQMSVHTNPYAKLCGAIVTEALRKEVLEHA